jgi:hypothetical protein
VIVCVIVAVCPLVSLTVSVTVRGPLLGYGVFVVIPEPLLYGLFPHVHVYDTIPMSSVDAEASK